MFLASITASSERLVALLERFNSSETIRNDGHIPEILTMLLFIRPTAPLTLNNPIPNTPKSPIRSVLSDVTKTYRTIVNATSVKVLKKTLGTLNTERINICRIFLSFTN